MLSPVSRLFRPVPVLIVVLSLFFAACSGGSEDGTATTVSSASVPPSTTAAAVTTTTVSPTSVVETPEYPDGFETREYGDWGTVALGRLNVLLEDPGEPEVVDDVAAAVVGEVTGAFGFIGLYQIQLGDNSSEKLTAAIEVAGAIPGVAEAFPDIEGQMLTTTCESTSPLNSPSYQQGDNAAHYEAIGLQNAWDIISASGVELNNVHVGVVDTAFMPVSNEDDGEIKILTPRGTTDQPSVDDDGKIDMSNLNHGTAVTHVIAADPDNGGVAGVASPLGSQLTVTVDNLYDNAPSRWVDDPDPDNPSQLVDAATGGVYTFPTLEKIMRQLEEGATVINMSYGPDWPDDHWSGYASVYRRFFEKMEEKYPNAVFVAAAGNEKGRLNGQNYFPGGLNLPNLITVAAVDQNGAAASFTNTTSGNGEVTIAAPGVNVPVGIDPTTDQVFTSSGTSFSTPMVTGAIALIQSINPKLTAAEIQKLLQATARDGVAARGDAETSTLIPDSVGGKIMRVDDAVLAAINGVRAAADPPQPPLDKEALLNATKFVVSASQTALGVFEISADVEGDQPGAMSFELFGEGFVSGDSRQSSPAIWEATLGDPSTVGSGKVCRTDANRCCVLTLESVSIAGTYSGSLVIGAVKALDDVIVHGPEGDEVVTKDECEDVYSEMLGQAFTLTISLSDDGAGNSGPFTATLFNPDGEATEVTPGTWTLNGSSVTIPLSFASTGYEGSFVLDGTVVFDDAGVPASIGGTWVMSGVVNLTLGGDFTLIREG